MQVIGRTSLPCAGKAFTSDRNCTRLHRCCV